MCYLAAEILLLLLFETVSHYVSVPDFELLILQACPCEFWDYRHALSKFFFFNESVYVFMDMCINNEITNLIFSV